MRLWLPLLAVAILVVAGVWLMNQEDSSVPKNDGSSVVDINASEPTTDVSLAVLSPENGAETKTDVSAADRSDTPKSPAQTTTESLPEAYRQALSGITGRLVDDEGQPVASMSVTLLEFRMAEYLEAANVVFDDPRLPRLDIGEDKTDDDGRFRFAGVHAEAFHALGIDLGGERGTLRFIDQQLHPRESYDLGEVRLEAFVTLVGEVVDANGEPVAGARVRASTVPAAVYEANVHTVRKNSVFILAEEGFRNVVSLPPDVMKWADLLPVPTTRTNKDGKFRLAGAPIGLVTTVIDKPGFQAAIKGPMPSGRSGERSVGTIQLGPGRVIRGRVVTPSNAPVSGAEIYVGSKLSLVAGGIGIPASPTDAEGRFEVAGVPNGGEVIVAAREQRGDPWKIVGPTPEEEITVTLEGRRSFLVRVQDAGQNPIEKAEIVFRPESFLSEVPVTGLMAFRPPPQEAVSVAPGVYRCDRLLVGNYQMMVRAPGFAPEAEGILVREDGSGEETVTLFGGIQIPVRVTSKATGEPLERAMVQAYTDRRDRVLDLKRTDPEGRALVGPIALRESDSGQNRLWIEHPGFAGSNVVIPFPIEGEIEVALEAGAELTGRVHLAGSPPDRSYMIVLTSFNGFQGGDHPAQDMPRFAITSLEDGTFRISNLPAGEARWELMERFLGQDPLKLFEKGEFEPKNVTRGSVTLEAGTPAVLDIDISEGALMAPGVVRGTVIVDGQPAAGFPVTGTAHPRVEGREQQKFEVVTDHLGQFVIEPVYAGSIYVEVKEPSEHEQRHSGQSVWTEWREMMPGETWEPRVVIERRDVTFQVTDITGLPLAGARVVATSEDGNQGSAAGPTDDRGMVTLRVSGDSFQVRAESGKMILEKQVDVSGNAGEVIVLQLSPPVPCSGTFELDPSLGDAEQVFIWLNSTESGVSRSASVGKGDRSFDFPGMVAGKYKIRCWAGGRMSKSIEFELSPQGSTNLSFHFESGGSWDD
ncbi:MAG: hypothetical protein RL885_13115 [Planctomycetota bacterium]